MWFPAEGVSESPHISGREANACASSHFVVVILPRRMALWHERFAQCQSKRGSRSRSSDVRIDIKQISFAR
jgi:hypothetical protein